MDIDAVLYVDTDVLFMTPPEHVWAHLSNFNTNETVGMVPSQPQHSGIQSWYEMANTVPYYEKGKLIDPVFSFCFYVKGCLLQKL